MRMDRGKRTDGQTAIRPDCPRYQDAGVFGQNPGVSSDKRDCVKCLGTFDTVPF